jgi:hypothetical protein
MWMIDEYSHTPSLTHTHTLTHTLTFTHTIDTFIDAVFERYYDNPYHNVYHAVSVMHATYVILMKFGGARYCRAIDVFGECVCV